MKNIIISLTFILAFSACVAGKNETKKSASTQNTSKITKTGSQTNGLKSIAGPRSIARNFVNEENSTNKDLSTANCPQGHLRGWKCLNTTVTTAENRDYKISLRWNRPLVQSRGTVIMAVGGAGIGDSMLDPTFKTIINELDQLDEVRMIMIEFLDAPDANNSWGGYFKHFGGYKSASLAFMGSIDIILASGIIKGEFLNYMGGSNASTVAAHAMAFHGADQFFDRVIFHMGPFMPSLPNACDPNSASSIYLNTPDQQKSVFDLLNYWNYGPSDRHVCNNLNNDRSSIQVGGKNIFPNTQVHVVVGAKEVTQGFGSWLLASNLEWYNNIQAKSKSRIVRPNMAHNTSFEDLRRYMRLAANEVAVEDSVVVPAPAPVATTCSKDSNGTFPNGSGTTQWMCYGCGQTGIPAQDSSIGTWVAAGNGCFHRALKSGTTAPTPAPAPQCKSSGQFCANKQIVMWTCECSGSMDASWKPQTGGACFHKGTTTACN